MNIFEGMKSPLLASVFCITMLAVGQAADLNLEPAPMIPKNVKPENPALVDVPDVPGLPRVMLIGDSISIGYTLKTRELLKGLANVHRPRGNCGDTASGLGNLDQMLGKEHWDVAEQQKKFPQRPASEYDPKHIAKALPGEIQEPFNVHFTPEGYDRLAELVAASVKKELPARP